MMLDSFRTYYLQMLVSGEGTFCSIICLCSFRLYEFEMMPKFWTTGTLKTGIVVEMNYKYVTSMSMSMEGQLENTCVQACTHMNAQTDKQPKFIMPLTHSK